jgi:CBS domain-containing protein
VALQLSLNQRPFLVLIQMAILLSALYFLRNYIPYAMSYVERFMGSREAVLAILLAIIFILGYFGEIAGFNDAIIALFIGFILSQYVVERPQLLDRLRGLTYGLFEPLFFGGLGLSVSLGFVINEAIPLMALIIALFLTKFTLGYATSILRGARNPLFAAIGSTFKGGVDGALLLAGLTVGVVSSRVYSISIVTILVIVLVCPLLLKLRISSVKDQISTRQGDNLLLPYIKWFSKNVTAEEMSRTLPNVILKGEEPLDRAIREMTDLRILGAVVTNDYGRPIGIVLLNNVVNLDPETRVKLKVEDVMEKEVPLVSSSAPAWEAMEIMKSKDLPLVAVVDEEGRVVGTISERELLLYMTK